MRIKQPPAKSLAACIQMLSQPITVDVLLRQLGVRGYHLLIGFLSLPFCLPIQLPGLSLPFGLLIAFLGMRSIYKHGLLLPKNLLQKQITPALFKKIVTLLHWLCQKMERISTPRILWLSTNRFVYPLHGITTVILGLLLAVPVPIPLTTIVCGMALLLLHFGLALDDGAFILAGYFFALLTIAFFGVIHLYHPVR